MAGTAGGQGLRDHRDGERDRRRVGAALRRARARRVVGIDLDAEQAVGGLTIAADVADEEQVRAALRDGRSRSSAGSTC